MRRIAAATLILIPLTLAAAPPRPTAAKPACDRFARVDHAGGAIQQGRAPSADRLDRLPAGDLHLAVERSVDGCRIPVIVRQDVGRAR